MVTTSGNLQIPEPWLRSKLILDLLNQSEIVSGLVKKIKITKFVTLEHLALKMLGNFRTMRTVEYTL